MTPDNSAQFRTPVLVFCAGKKKLYRIAFIGGPIDETIKEFDSYAEAAQAYRVAKASEAMVRLAVA